VKNIHRVSRHIYASVFRVSGTLNEQAGQYFMQNNLMPVVGSVSRESSGEHIYVYIYISPSIPFYYCSENG
jgi:hypothetical protein